MSEAARIREVVEDVITEVLNTEVAGLRAEISHRVLQELEPLIAAREAAATERLQAAVSAIQGASSQTDILSALLDGTARFAGRVALFVLRGSSAVGWQGRGFVDNDAVKMIKVDVSTGLAALAAQQRLAVSGPTQQFHASFATALGAPLDHQCLVAPLVVREKLAALLYADAGVQPEIMPIEAGAIGVLGRCAEQWIELLSLRKALAMSASVSVPPATQPVVASKAPVAVDVAGARAQPAVASAVHRGTPTGSAVTVPTVVHERPAARADDDQELHRKAKRFAKLLVDEIKLYNQAKVREGKQSGDLYDRLKDDIEKSRATYDRRYASTCAAASDYFTQALVHGLADDNADLLGSNFPR